MNQPPHSLEDYQKILDDIAIAVSLSKHGSFLTTFATAWQLADPYNKRVLTPAWLNLINKYELANELTKFRDYPTQSQKVTKND